MILIGLLTLLNKSETYACMLNSKRHVLFIAWTAVDISEIYAEAELLILDDGTRVRRRRGGRAQL